jgi:cell division protease FtsH
MEDRTISYSTFLAQVEAGNVTSLRIGEQATTGVLEEPFEAREEGAAPVTEFVTIIPSMEDGELLRRLEEHDVEVTSEPRQRGDWTLTLLTWAPLLLLIGLGVMLARRMRGQGAQMFNIGQSKAKLYDRSKQKTRFDDAAGVEGPKAELQELVEFLRDPLRFHIVGAQPPRGVLLVGPPGTGKTLLARATAGEADVPFFSITGSNFMEMFVGVGASRVRDLFREARRAAPSIVFIDEIDSIGRRRGAGLGGGHDEREQTLNQLLSELDGFEPHHGVVVLAATNRADILDPALERPGRFDRKIMVEPPNVKGRREILEVQARERPLGDDVDLLEVARATPGFTGAELENLLNEAALLAARRNKVDIEQEDLEVARDKIMLGLERKGLVLTDAERRMLAYHEAGHALVAMVVPCADPLHKVSIVPRGMSMGATQTIPLRDRFVLTREYLADRLAVLMGGRAAEIMVFDTRSNGSAQDLAEVTKLARTMVLQWGMSDSVGHVVLAEEIDNVFLGHDLGQQRKFSDATAKLVDDEVRSLAEQAFHRATEIVELKRQWLDRLVEKLLEKEEVSREEVSALEPEGDSSRTAATANPQDSLCADDVEDADRENLGQAP